ncbi:MAG: Rqc2 family fibronectin-binding protein [bacterium]|jgi:predicted ribosome quality control (RQC) complex YloA/Tae2 family protein
MTIDGFVLSALKQELEKNILPARVNKIYQRSQYEILILLHRPGENLTLLISSDPRFARVHLTDSCHDIPPAPPRFCSLLRKHLEGSKLVDIKRPGFERILDFYFQSRSELGDPAIRVLTIEIMGKHSNIIFRESPTGKILDSITHVTFDMSRYRQVLPGILYALPPAQEKINPLQVRELTFYSLLQTLQEPLVPALVHTFAGLSPLLAKELVYRAKIEKDMLPIQLARNQLSALWQGFSQLVNSIQEDNIEPVVVLTADKQPLAFSIMPLAQYANQQQLSFSSINAAINYYYNALKLQQSLSIQKQKLQNLINKKIKRLTATIKRQEESLNAMDKAEIWRHQGELLTANLYRIPPGEQQIEVEDFYNPAGEKLTIALDPSLSPAANAQRYFNRYQKAKQGKPQLEKHLNNNLSERDYLEGIKLAINDANTTADINEIISELNSQGYLPIHNQTNKNTAKKDSHPPRPLCYYSRDGFTIIVGKNNRQNDYLTKRVAKSDDYWFHAQGMPGAHVILRCLNKKKPSLTAIEDAAYLAAFYSKGRFSNRVPVDYTQVANVRKPKGARPGMVIYDHYQTIFVNPTAAKLKELKQATKT